MKKTTSKILFIFLIMSMSIFLFACNKDNGNGDGSPSEEDKYGYSRQIDSFLVETLILPDMPDDRADFFGKGGESGLAGEWAVENDGKINYDGENNLVILIYGSIEYGGGFLEFSLTDGEEIYYGNECVDVGSPRIYNAEADVDINMNAASVSRVSFMHKSGLMDTGMLDCAVIVIPFEVKREGVLRADFQLTRFDYGANAEVKVDSNAKAYAYKSGTTSQKVDISEFSVGYISDADYNWGDYSESAIKSSIDLSGGDNGYLVLDFTFAHGSRNHNAEYINLIAGTSHRDIVSITVEEAPTSDITEKVTAKGTTLLTTFSIPDEGEKSVRVIIRLMPLSDGVSAINLALSAKEGTMLEGTSEHTALFYAGQPLMSYTINEDGKSYTLKSVNESMKHVEIPMRLSDGKPVTAIGVGAFAKCRELESVTIPDTVTRIDVRAFEGCSYLSRVVIPESVSYVGDYAFLGCYSIKIYCAHESDPGTWGKYWMPGKPEDIVWGYKGK
ncbi:MAG: leucine-rich repeat domain-containing protein [Ruminococcaceae bacterium]|nr:leucine-rich repeat domain-containing protein [Oscillospiraceae bacterium]